MPKSIKDIGLQFFADEPMEAANAEVVDIATSEGVADPIANTEPAVEPVAEQQPTETQAVAKRIKEVAAKAAADAEAAAKQKFDATIARLYADQGITTYEQLAERLAQQETEAEAAKNNVPVEFYTRLSDSERKAQEALDKLSHYERKEAIEKEAVALEADPRWGEFYKENKPEIHEYAERLGCPLDTAKLLVLDKKGVPKQDTEAIKQAAIQEYRDSLKQGYKPVEGSGATPVVVPSTPKTFKEAREASVEYLKSLQR